MIQEVKITLTLTVAINADLNKSKIKKLIKKSIADGLKAQPPHLIEHEGKTEIFKVLEEAEIYGND